MKVKELFAMAALGLFLSTASIGQGPVGDEVMVTFDRQVHIGSQTLPAGKYTIRQVTSASNPRILEFTTDHGTKLHATIAAIPVLQNIPPGKTTLVFDEGGQSRLSKIWVQGKSYGYEFPGKSTPSSASSAMTLEGRFAGQPVPAQTAAVQEPSPAPAPVAQAAPAENNRIAQNRPAEVPAQVPTPAREQAPADNTLTAQNRPAPAPAATETPVSRTPAPETLPSTASGWMGNVAMGLALISAGFFVSWSRRAAL